MVIDQIDIRGIALLEPEDDPPVGPNGDCSNNPPTRLSAGAAESPVNRVARGASLHRSESACARSCRRAAGSTRAGRRLRKDGVSRGVESDGSRQTPIVTIVTCQTRKWGGLSARHGIECPDITGAGTGSFEFEAASGVYTELQCGSYIFMDADYVRNLDHDGAPTKAFEPSLFVWPASRRWPSIPTRRSSPTSPPRPTSASPTSTAASPSRPPPTGSTSATRSA